MISYRRCALLLAALVAACDSGSSPAGDGPDWIAAEAKPVHLELTLDTSRAVRRVITDRGGTLIATGADGIRYRLRIPEGAVTGYAEITMTPVAAVKGLPLSGGTVAAVDLEPDGLQLRKAATLSIANTPDVPVAEQVAYAYARGGKDAHLYPLTRDPTRIEMQLYHFSGYGFGKAPPNDPGRLSLQQAAAYENRMIARLSESIAKERQRQLDGAPPGDEPLMTEADFSDYYTHVVRPLLQIALSDHRMFQCCSAKYVAWERQMQLSMADPPAEGSGASTTLAQQRAEAADMWRRAFQHALEQERTRMLEQCRRHDLTAAKSLIGLERTAQLLGFRSDEQQLRADLANCVRFEVEFRSTFDNRGPAGMKFVYQLAADASAAMEDFRIESASTPLEYRHFQAAGNPKQAVTGPGSDDPRSRWMQLGAGPIVPAGTRPGTFGILSIDIDSTQYIAVEREGVNCDGEDAKTEADSIGDLTITFTVGEPTELVRHLSPVAGAAVFEQQGWLFQWSQAHGDALLRMPNRDDEAPPLYRMQLKQGEPGVWRVDFDEQSPTEMGYSLLERGSLTIRHAPR